MDNPPRPPSEGCLHVSNRTASIRAQTWRERHIWAVPPSCEDRNQAAPESALGIGSRCVIGPDSGWAHSPACYRLLPIASPTVVPR
jgi:hypothetical protein